MSGATGDDAERAAFLRARLGAGLRQIAFFVVPSAMAFLALGDVVTGALYQTGAFTREMTVYVWGILAGSAVGLLASTMGRLYASTYYALHDTRTPLRFALVRVALTIGLGYLAALPLPRAAGDRSAMGRGGTHRVGRHRGLGGVRPAPSGPQPAHRADRPAGGAWPRGSGAPRQLAAGAAWGLRMLVPVERADSHRPAAPDRLRRGVFWPHRPPRRARGRGGDETARTWEPRGGPAG